MERMERMKKVIVTGATSMLGVALIEECVRNDVEVWAVVREHSKRLERLPKSALVHVVNSDLGAISDINFPSDDYDCLYHFAWAYTSKSTRNNPELQLMNIRYTLDAVRLAERSGCKKFIGAGSQAEYGMCKDIITTQMKVEPESAYGICKYAAGKLSKKLCNEYGIVCVWGRVFSLYGENDNDGTMIQYAFKQFYAGRTAYFSAGTQMWNYLYASDAGKMFYLMGKKCTENRVYNVAYHKSQMLKTYISEMKDVLGDGFCYDLMPDDGVEKVQLNPDTTETNRELEYFPETSFEKGIKILKDIGYGQSGGGCNT